MSASSQRPTEATVDAAIASGHVAMLKFIWQMLGAAGVVARLRISRVSQRISMNERPSSGCSRRRSCGHDVRLQSSWSSHSIAPRICGAARDPARSSEGIHEPAPQPGAGSSEQRRTHRETEAGPPRTKSVPSFRTCLVRAERAAGRGPTRLNAMPRVERGTPHTGGLSPYPRTRGRTVARWSTSEQRPSRETQHC